MRILSTSVLLAFSIVSATRLSLSKMDNFDKDKNTVSEYDHMHFYPNRSAPAAEPDRGLTQKSSDSEHQDNYDKDKNTVSEYDHMKQYEYWPKKNKDGSEPEKTWATADRALVLMDKEMTSTTTTLAQKKSTHHKERKLVLH